MANERDFDFFLLTPKDFDEVTDILAKEYFPREPLSMSLHTKNIQPAKGRIGEDIRKCLESGMSVGVRHLPTGQLLGVSIVKAESRTESPSLTDPPEELTVYFHVYDEVMKAVDAFEEKEVNKVMSFYMLTVHRDYTWRGLGTKLVEFSAARGIEEGCHNAIVCISNKFSYRIFVRLGFEARHFFDLLPHREEWGLDIPALQGNTTLCAMTKRLP